MNRKYLILMLFVFLLAVTAVSAEDNDTSVIESDGADLMMEEGDDSYNAQIIAKDVSIPYSNYAEFSVKLQDNNGKPINAVNNLKIQYEDDEDYPFDVYKGKYFFFTDREVGNHKATLILEDSSYKAKPVTINVKIFKANVKMKAKKWVSTTKEYATLKAIVKDKDGEKVDEGSVTFKIDGKKYTVKVKNGVATKKVKLKNAKNYNYKATFTSKNYNSKTATSTVYVKQARKYYTLTYGKYSVKLSYKKYVKVLHAKNKGKLGYADVDTGIKRPPEWGGGHYYVGISTNDEYHSYYGHPIHDYLFLRASNYLGLKKVNFYTTNFN